MKNVYFVTGGTGAIGSAVVPLLLENDTNEIRLLIRAKSTAGLKKRMEDLYEFWGYPAQDFRKKRIKPVLGDVSESDFGLDQETYLRLVGECTHIVHCAGAVRMNLPIEQARICAVDSAKQIIKLARLCQKRNQLKKVEFVSTLGVNGKSSDPLAESWDLNDKEFHNSYEQSKAEAEEYLKGCLDLPITVHRPSMVVGNSETGIIIHFQIFYHICEFLSGRRTWGFFPFLGDAYLDTVPVDYVGRAICWSSTQDKTIGKILHLCSGPEARISLVDLSEKVRIKFLKTGVAVPKLKFLPLQLVTALIPVLAALSPKKLKKAIRTLPVLLEYLKTNQIFLNNASRKLLADGGIHLPLPREYLDSVLDNYFSATCA